MILYVEKNKENRAVLYAFMYYTARGKDVATALPFERVDE